MKPSIGLLKGIDRQVRCALVSYKLYLLYTVMSILGLLPLGVYVFLFDKRIESLVQKPPLFNAFHDDSVLSLE